MTNINLTEHQRLITPMQFLMDMGQTGYDTFRLLEPELPEATIDARTMSSSIIIDDANQIHFVEIMPMFGVFDIHGTFEGDIDKFINQLNSAVDKIETFLNVNNGQSNDPKDVEIRNQVQSAIDTLLSNDTEENILTQ